MLSTLLHLCLEPPFYFFYSCVQDGYRDHHSPTYFDESETEETFRVFVALFDYDPLSMSPNPDAADEELPFKEGQIIRVGFLKKNNNKIF